MYNSNSEKVYLKNGKVVSLIKTSIAMVLGNNLQPLKYITETKPNPGKIYGNSGMVHFAEVNWKHTGRVARMKLVPRHCLRYLQPNLIMGERGLVSGFI